MTDRLTGPLLAVMLTVAATGAMAGPLEDGEAAVKRQDYPAALKILRPLAEQGDPAAQAQLGIMYYSGMGVTEDHVQGAVWTRKAATQGNAQARGWLMLVCMGPEASAAEHCDEVFAAVRALAEKGDPGAERQLGSMYLLGKGVPSKDPAQAVVWLRKAADQGYALAESQLGMMYGNGLMGVPADQAQSLAWLRKAAEQGDVAALTTLAMEYANGLNVPKDEAEAAGYYRKLADKGDPSAQMELAKMYEEGRGVTADPAQAIALYKLAAEKGLGDAASKVGSAYALGKGVPQDYAQAYVWLDLAVAEALPGAGPDDTSLARDSVGGHLSAAQLAGAKAQSAALKAKIDAQ